MSRQELLAANGAVLERNDVAGGPAGSTPGGAGPGATIGPGGTSGTIGATPGAVGPGGGGSDIGTPGETGPIVIGSVGNYSGLAGPPQAPMAKAVQVWAEYVNSRGGLFGRPVQLIVVDDRGDPAQHVAALRDLVENRHVVAFVSNAAALTVASGRRYLESVGVPVIGTACANTTEFESPIMFPQCTYTPDFFFGIIRSGVLNGGGATKLAYLYCAEAQVCTDGYNYTIGNGAAARAGAEVVYTARVSLAQPDFTSECRNARDAGAQLMHVLVDPTGVIRAAQSCARQGYYPIYVQGSATVFYDTKDRPGFNKLIVSTQVFPFVGSDTPARAEFQQVFESFYGQPPGPAEAYGWASAKVFELAASRAAQMSRSISPKTLVAALHTFRNETLGGLTVPLTFPAGSPAKNAPCWFSLIATNGNWSVLNKGQPSCRT